MRISDWSSDVCSSDLLQILDRDDAVPVREDVPCRIQDLDQVCCRGLRRSLDGGEPFARSFIIDILVVCIAHPGFLPDNREVINGMSAPWRRAQRCGLKKAARHPRNPRYATPGNSRARAIVYRASDRTSVL